MARRTLFLTSYERLLRVKALMRHYGWEWKDLEREARSRGCRIRRTLRCEEGEDKPVSLNMLKSIARALGVTVGFLVDRGVISRSDLPSENLTPTERRRVVKAVQERAKRQPVRMCLPYGERTNKTGEVDD